jgi:amino acid adenylation domain-containing protein
MQTVIDLIERSFSLHRSKVAIRLYDHQWTYNDLQNLSNKVSGFLAESGIKKGERVIVLMNKSIYFYAAVVGIMKSGGVYVPLDTRTPSSRLARILEDISPFRVFIDRHAVKHYRECQDWGGGEFRTLYLDDDGPNGDNGISLGGGQTKDGDKYPSLSPEDLALILYTSGSTGVPKGAMITHGNLYHIINFTIDAFDFGPEEVGSAFNANAFDMSIADMLPVLCSGGTLGVYPEEIIFPRDILELTYKYGVTKMFSVPSTLTSLVNSNLIQPDRLKLKDIMLGGETIPVNMLNRIMSMLPGTRFHNCYGPTETTLYTSKHTFGEIPGLQATQLPIGFPIADNRFTLDRKDFENEKMKGELLITGPQVGAGYWNNPEKTKDAFGINDNGERFYRTGDIASFDPKVGYFIHGRKDHQIKYMGYRIELGEIEYTLSLLPLVKENVVIPIYENGKIKELRVIYSSERNCDKEISKHLSRNLPSYMIPRSMIHVESLPKNQNLKIDRVLIKEMYGRN